MARRAPGRSELSTARKEKDTYIIESGMLIAQALAAEEIWLGCKINREIIADIAQKMQEE
jgi:Chorismate synthase